MKKRLRSLCLLVAVAMMIFLVPQVTFATEIDTEPEDTRTQADEEKLEETFTPDVEIQASGGKKSIFFRGTIVGWFIDGAIKYVTGKAPSEFVTWGLKTIERKIVSYLSTPLYVSAYVYPGGYVEGRTCTVYPCPIAFGADPIVQATNEEGEEE